MQVKYIILIFLNVLTFSFQIVPTRIFCDNFLREIYLIDENTHSQKTIAIEKIERMWDDHYSYDNLNVDPGALIKFKCYNVDGPTLGAGCFLINNKCRCYTFNIDGQKINYGNPMTYKVQFKNNIKCEYTTYWLYTFDPGDYYYYHYVPSDVDGITCKKRTVTVPINVLTNLKISVTENYRYFTLNNKQLSSDVRFNILSELKTFSDKSLKINIKFKNYGVVIENNKICEFNIRFCYNSCQKCNDIDPSESFHQCLICKDGFYFIENTTNCMTKEQMKDSHYYFDDNKKIFRPCFNDCLTCLEEGNLNDMKCKSCDIEKYFAEPNNCIKDITNYFYSKEEKKYKKCYKSCYGCYENSNENNHLCKNCTDGYHFIYNDKGKCIKPEEKPSNTYLNIKTNTYEKCFDRCSTCDEDGDILNNNCKECLKDDNNNYLYYFIYSKKGKCIKPEEKPSNTYLNIKTNTYEKCFDRCSTCDEGGDILNNNCKECLKDDNNNYLYHFIYNEKGKCIPEDKKEGLLYLDNKDNTYKLCPEGTTKVENNECIKSTVYPYIFIIFPIVILFALIMFLIIRIKNKRSKKKEQIEIEKEANDLTQLINI